MGRVADTTTGQPWVEDTMVLTYSTTKGATAMCANRLAEQGLLDVDAPVVRYWPESAQGGKDAVTVADSWPTGPGSPGSTAPCRSRRRRPGIRSSRHWPDRFLPGIPHRSRLPRRHLRLPGGRSGAADQLVGPSAPTSAKRSPALSGADWYIGLPAVLEPRVARLVPFETGADGNLFDGLGSLGGGSEEDPGMAELLAQLAPYIGRDEY